MDSKEINELLDRYFEGNFSDEEKALVERAYLLQDEPYSKEISDERYDEIKRGVYDSLNLRQVETKGKYVLWSRVLRIASVAAAVTAIVFGVWFYTNEVASSRKASDNDVVYKNDIKPGRNSATITLANGKIINLSDAKTGVVIDAGSLKYNDGSALANLSPSGRDAKGREGNNSNNPLPDGERSKVQMLTASTPRGGTYQITLPDGTKVWLNADSKISFPSQFSGMERKILLSGEAYFEVAKAYTSLRGQRTKQSFVVQTERQEVEVLGTHFNISSYEDEPNIKTTLLEGVVEISSRDVKPGLHYRLKPNQQSILSDKGIKVIKVDTEEVIAWKNGKTQFSQQDIKSIMLLLSRWYNIEVQYEGPVPEGKFGGSVSRSKNISEILKVLELTGEVHFKIEGRRVTVTK